MSAQHTPGPLLTVLEGELLDALLQIEGTFQASEGRIGTGRYSFPANGATADVLRAAITKATGSAAPQSPDDKTNG